METQNFNVDEMASFFARVHADMAGLVPLAESPLSKREAQLLPSARRVVRALWDFNRAQKLDLDATVPNAADRGQIGIPFGENQLSEEENLLRFGASFREELEGLNLSATSRNRFAEMEAALTREKALPMFCIGFAFDGQGLPTLTITKPADVTHARMAAILNRLALLV